MCDIAEAPLSLCGCFDRMSATCHYLLCPMTLKLTWRTCDAGSSVGPGCCWITSATKNWPRCSLCWSRARPRSSTRPANPMSCVPSQSGDHSDCEGTVKNGVVTSARKPFEGSWTKVINCQDFLLSQATKWWARLGLNQRPLRCQRSALPLSYAPLPFCVGPLQVDRRVGRSGKCPKAGRNNIIPRGIARP